MWICKSQTFAPVYLHYVYFLLPYGPIQFVLGSEDCKKRGAQFWEEQSDGESD